MKWEELKQSILKMTKFRSNKGSETVQMPLDSGFMNESDSIACEQMSDYSQRRSDEKRIKELTEEVGRLENSHEWFIELIRLELIGRVKAGSVLPDCEMSDYAERVDNALGAIEKHRNVIKIRKSKINIAKGN